MISDGSWGHAGDRGRLAALGGHTGAAQRGDNQCAQPPPDLELLARKGARHHPHVDRVEFDALHSHHLRLIEQQVGQATVFVAASAT